MKYLLLLLISFNAYAFKYKIEYSNNKGWANQQLEADTQENLSKELERFLGQSKIIKGDWTSLEADSIASREGMESLEYYHPSNFSLVLVDDTAEKAEQAINKAIERKLACGNSTIKYVAKSNIKKNLNKAQRKQMVLGFSEIFDLLKSGSVDIAKDEITLVEADGVIVTEQDKTDTIAFITGCE